MTSEQEIAGRLGEAFKPEVFTALTETWARAYRELGRPVLAESPESTPG